MFCDVEKYVKEPSNMKLNHFKSGHASEDLKTNNNEYLKIHRLKKKLSHIIASLL